jgi:hypothetical protein
VIRMEVEVEFEQEFELECPHCKKKATHTVHGTAIGEVEPPERDCGF